MAPHLNDSWLATAALWAWAILNWTFSGLSGANVILITVTVVYTLIKIGNELTRRRILQHTREQQTNYRGPLRRITDPRSDTSTTPGALDDTSR